MSKFFKTLENGFFTDKNGFKTSFYFSKNPKKPLAILIHGFGGNAYGMSFLARELSEDFQILLLEMPNHGKSDFQKIKKAEQLQIWLEGFLALVEKDFGEISLLVCHSMSCFTPTQKIASKIPTALINPVFQTPARAIFGIKISANPLVASFTNLPIFSPFKAAALIKTWRAQSVKNVFENLIFSIVSPIKFARQASMAKIPLDEPFFSGEYSEISMIFHGEKDALTLPLSEKNRQKFFPRAKITNLETGHLAPIEIPRIIAQEICKNLRKK